MSFSRSVAVGVGHNKDSVTEVRGTNGGSGYAVPLRVIPALGQVSENSAKPPPKQCWYVLHKHDSRSYHANEAVKLTPQSASASLDSDSLACNGDVLAREAACDEVDVGQGGNASHVSISGNIGPMLFEDSSAELIYLYLPCDRPSCPFEAQVHASHAGEEGAEGRHSPYLPLGVVSRCRQHLWMQNQRSANSRITDSCLVVRQ